MRSKTSFFNAAIYRHTLKRFWPLWGAYAMILFIITPLRLMGTNLTNYAQADKLYLVTGQILRAAWTDGCVLSFIMAAATAMAEAPSSTARAASRPQAATIASAEPKRRHTASQTPPRGMAKTTAATRAARRWWVTTVSQA